MVRPTVIYLCNAIDQSIKKARHITTDSPAATNKVLGLARALSRVEVRCFALSLGRGRQTGSGEQYGATVRRSNRVSIFYCAFWNLPVLTHFVTMVSLAFWLWQLIDRHPCPTVLVYNRAYHYVPALVIARLMRTRICLDLEDGYIIGGGGRLAHLKNTLTRALFNWLCPDGAMVANSGLVSQLTHHNPLVCYGVAESENEPQQDWQVPRLQLLFSGTLLEEVGSQLLLATLIILREKRPSLVNHLHFVVTGKGPFGEAFRSFATLAPDWLSYGESLPREVYLEQLRNCHVGLSLRLANFEMGGATFPSKVVEYAQHGLLVLTTRASDVPILFSEAALYLEEETPEALVLLLASLLERRSELQEMAFSGRERVSSSCSPEIVGQALKRLLFVGTPL